MADVIARRALNQSKLNTLREFGEPDDAFDISNFFCSGPGGYITGRTITMAQMIELGFDLGHTDATAAWKASVAVGKMGDTMDFG